MVDGRKRGVLGVNPIRCYLARPAVLRSRGGGSGGDVGAEGRQRGADAIFQLQRVHLRVFTFANGVIRKVLAGAVAVVNGGGQGDGVAADFGVAHHLDDYDFLAGIAAVVEAVFGQGLFPQGRGVKLCALREFPG